MIIFEHVRKYLFITAVKSLYFDRVEYERIFYKHLVFITLNDIEKIGYFIFWKKQELHFLQNTLIISSFSRFL